MVGSTQAVGKIEARENARVLLRQPRIPEPYFRSDDGSFVLYQGDCISLLPAIFAHIRADLIFADPPYFLSNGGITCHAGKMVSVYKGDWDRLMSVDQMHEFNRSWLNACQQMYL